MLDWVWISWYFSACVWGCLVWNRLVQIPISIPFSLALRFIKLLDSVLHHLVPAWDHTVGTFSKLKVSDSPCVLWGLSLAGWLHLGCGKGGSQCLLPLKQLKGNTWLSSVH